MRWAFEDWYIDFYPRSPCGERHKSVETITVNFTFLSTLSLRRATGSAKRYQAYFDISIHALLAESDRLRRKELQRNHISIHALLAESDKKGSGKSTTLTNFYPRSPCGERQRQIPVPLGWRYFYPRSPCGERRWFQRQR